MAMSREQKIAVVEAYLDSLVSKNVSQVHFAEGVTFEGSANAKVDGSANDNWILSEHHAGS